MSDQLKTVLDAVSAKLTTEALIEMNTATSGNEGIDPDEAAREVGTGQRFRQAVDRRKMLRTAHDHASTDVTKKYPDGTVAVDDLTLEVPEGTLAVFVGPSGCGKTTSMRMINRMIDPTSGTLTVDGKDVTKVDAVKLRLGIGYVIQSAGLMPHLQGGRQRRDRAGAAWASRGAAARKAALGVMERVGLDPKLADRYPAQLSGGQQQRVGVARALAADPPILLMDEPFSAVDPVVREELQTEILRLQSELRKTIVFVTHDIDEAIKLGEKVAVFGRGGVLQQYDAAATSAVEPGQRLRRRASSAPTAATADCSSPRRPACRCTTSGRSRSPASTRSTSAPTSGRWSTKPDGTPYAWIDVNGVRAAPARKVVVRQHDCRRFAVPARTAPCGWRSTPRCRRRPGSASPSTTASRSSAGSRPTTSSPRSKHQRGRRPSAVSAHPPRRRLGC